MYVTFDHGGHPARLHRRVRSRQAIATESGMLHAMNNSSNRLLPRVFCAWFMMAAPLAFAQAPPGAAPPPSPAAAPPAAPDPEHVGYLLGLGFGEQLHNVGINDQVSIDSITRGLKDGLKGGKSTPADQRQVQEYVRSVIAASIIANQTAAKDFLAKNGHEKGVITTASGLEYKIITAGDKKAPAVKTTDSITVQYRGTLLDGKEFDSTYTRGAPATFTVTGVIPGWQEALVLMKPGAKWQLFVPPDLAYGSIPKAGIPGGSLLIFEVELLSVKSSTPVAAVPPPGRPQKPPPKSFNTDLSH
jgi:FKBP-type peptidyl-prolyl cis-trans isomerase FklB